MATLKQDPSLTLAKIGLVIFEIVTVFSLVMIAIGAAGVLTFGRSEILADLAADGAPGETYAMIIVALALLAGFLLASLAFAIQLKRIVHSVDEGDPFHPDNARRLTRMAIYAVLAQACLLILDAIGSRYAQYDAEFGDGPRLGLAFTDDSSLIGFALAVVLFILARVFRQGAAMREELEGTV